MLRAPLAIPLLVAALAVPAAANPVTECVPDVGCVMAHVGLVGVDATFASEDGDYWITAGGAVNPWTIFIAGGVLAHGDATALAHGECAAVEWGRLLPYGGDASVEDCRGDPILA